MRLLNHTLDELLCAYVDNQLPNNIMHDIEARIAEDPDIRDRVEVFERIHLIVQQALRKNK